MNKIFFTILITICTENAIGYVSPRISFEKEYKELYVEIVEKLQDRHYKGAIINDIFSKNYFTNYLENIDPNKAFLLKKDIDEFKKWQYSLDDLMISGDITPGYEIYNRLLNRAISQLHYNIEILESDFIFDLESPSFFVTDVKKRDWPKNLDAARQHWRDILTDGMIRLLLNDKKPLDARAALIKRYKNQIKQYLQRNSQDVFQQYVNSFAELYDPHTAYYSPRNSENFQINMSLSLEGIGAELRTEDDYTKVIRVIPGGPADLQGILQAEDQIIGVGQQETPIVDVIGWRIDNVVNLIRGPKGSLVRLQVIPARTDHSGASKIIEITRDKVKLEEKSAQKHIIKINRNGDIFRLGVLDIPAFYMDFEAFKERDPNYKSTTRDVRNLLKELEKEKVDGIVLDLRNNGGGSLREAINLTDLFIDPGPVVQIRDARRRTYQPGKALYKSEYTGPLIVVTNRLSASASEITAGALQDYGRALIVGSQTFGKGTVQDVTPLTTGQLKVTNAKFYRISGDSTQHRGVWPDIIFPSSFDPEEVGESHRETALPWDRVSSVRHKVSGNLKQYLRFLQKSHEVRVSSGSDFGHLKKQLSLDREWRDQDLLSLSLEARREQIQKLESAQLFLENNRRNELKLPPYATIDAWNQAENIKNAKTHVIEKGDSLSLIASRYKVSIPQIIEANSMTAEDKLAIGDTLKLGKKKSIFEPDPILKEAGQILIDQILLQSKGIKPQQLFSVSVRQ